MSFRVKLTHAMLRGPQEPTNNDNDLSFLRDDDEKTNEDDEYYYLNPKQKQPVNNGPRVSNQQGMAIRTVAGAQPDYM